MKKLQFTNKQSTGVYLRRNETLAAAVKDISAIRTCKLFTCCRVKCNVFARRTLLFYSIFILIFVKGFQFSVQFHQLIIQPYLAKFRQHFIRMTFFKWEVNHPFYLTWVVICHCLRYLLIR